MEHTHVGGDEKTSDSYEHLIEVLLKEERRNLTNAEEQKVEEGVRESQFGVLNLAEYVLVKENYCHLYHNDCKQHCKEMVKAGKTVLEERSVSLPSLWRRSFPTINYDSEKAQRKLLQMPIACLKFTRGCFVVEKRGRGLYEEIKSEICSKFTLSEQTKNDIRIQKYAEELKSLVKAAPNSGERERIKHLMASSNNMTSRQASKLRIWNPRRRAEKVVAETEKINGIKSKHLYFAKVEQKVYLQSIGRSPDFYLSESSSSESEHSEDEDNLEADDITSTVDSPVQDAAVHQQGHHLPSKPHQSEMSCPNSNKETNLTEVNINSAVALIILRGVEWNWFSFVFTLESKFEKKGHPQEVVDQFLADFASQLPNMGLNIEQLNQQLNLVEQSRAAYLSELLEKEKRIQEIIEDVSSSDDDSVDNSDEGDCSEELSEEEIRTKLKLIKDKAKRKATAEIEFKRLGGKRKSAQTTKSVLSRHPDIGEIMEKNVKEADVGADKWRRTGVYTFTGDTKKEKCMTFKKLQEKLCSHYGEKFSYGTVIQLCVHRNKRRKSSTRYKGAANIKYQRPRKGFNLKFNPDTKWSRSLYKCLDQLQIDGKDALILNRDDQAGFRLDSTFTHKSTPSLNVDGPTLTTHTDFLNKHQTQLQTTSYNFTKTSNTSEVCIGAVKAAGIHQKNPAQHASDLDMLQKKDALKSIFYEDSGFAKDIEYIRVDGASDEGPSHHKVQFLWTERHMNRPTKVTLVTTRASGDSFLNRVELQNGCLGRGHSNLFIPSTLCGQPYDEEGQFSETKHHKNLEAALAQYIEQVDGTPCMGTTISLYRGASDHVHLERRNRLLRFLRGTDKERKELKEQHPSDYDYFEKSMESTAKPSRSQPSM